MTTEILRSHEEAIRKREAIGVGSLNWYANETEKVFNDLLSSPINSSCTTGNLENLIHLEREWNKSWLSVSDILIEASESMCVIEKIIDQRAYSIFALIIARLFDNIKEWSIERLREQDRPLYIKRWGDVYLVPKPFELKKPLVLDKSNSVKIDLRIYEQAKWGPIIYSWYEMHKKARGILDVAWIEY